MRAVAAGFPIAKGVPVMNCYGHFGNIACFVGSNDFLLAVCRRKNKAVVLVKLNRRSVYGNCLYVLLVNCNRLRFAINLAVLNAADYRLNIVKRYAV